MFSFCKDIVFTEQLKQAGFQQTFFLVMADDHLFYEGSGDNIYGYFRASKALHGRITKPTGKKDTEVFIGGTYMVKWLPVTESLKYVLIETQLN